MSDYERSWHKSPFHGQNIMPGLVRDQGDRPSCIFNVYCATNEIEYKRALALEDPLVSTDILFDVDSYIQDYENFVGYTLGNDPPGRLQTAERLFKEQGVFASASVWDHPRRLSMFQSVEHPGITFEGVEDLLSQGRPVMGGFTVGIDKSFERLGRDEVYSFDPDASNDGTYPHLVVFVGSGKRGCREYLVFLNSEGDEFGEDGFGRVWFDQVRGFRTVDLWPAETPPSSPSPASSSSIRSPNPGDDESQYRKTVVSPPDSRQLGLDTVKCLLGSSVLVSGLQGLGAEIAKNLVLAGVESLTLHDVCDLSSNFFLSEKDVGNNRAQACFQKIKELDNVVITSTLTGDLTKEQLANFQAVVFTDISLEKAIEFDDYCHSHQPPIAFIKSEVCGLFGSVFCDFGPEFTVLDVDGEEPHTGIIASISNDVSSEVVCVDDNYLKFKDGDLVVFSELHGMTELNDGKPRKIKNSRPYSFAIEEDTSSFGKYVGGGIVTQVKPAKVIKFKPLKDAMIEPGVVLSSDISKFESAPLLHLAFHALDKFRNEFRRFPTAGCIDDVQRMIDFAISINETLGDRKLEEIDRKCLHHFASGSKAVLNPMSAIFGGIVGQEVVKACSRKFHPIYQFFYFDSVESLSVEPLEPGDLKPENTRYDGQISVFGSKFQNKLEQAKFFMVGLGQYGCEFLKNVALMGMSCNQNGKLTVIDDDVIEESNLSRQFLLREGNVGQSKSTAAATAALAINPKLHVKVVQKRAILETETVFDDSFWESLDAVVSVGLDNVTERMYIDSKCVYFQKPHLEFGILGAKCNTQMVIPYLAENHAATRDPPEKPAAKCTVHRFPHNIGQCVIWARSEFEGLLEKTPIEVNSFLSNPSAYLAAARTAADAQARDQLERVMEWLDRDKCVTFQDCIMWARFKFEDYFSNRVKQLTLTFPEDSVTSSGAPFWSAPKRFPRPLEFSSADKNHLSFVLAASILRADACGIPIPDWAKTPNNKLGAEAVNKVIVPHFEPNEPRVEDGNSISAAAAIEEISAKLIEISKTLPPGFNMKPIQFEKDDDSNFHMDVIAGFANLLARNYSIPQVDKLKAKLLIAGRSERIIPVIATSTAMAAGIICLELYKTIKDQTDP